MRRHVTSRIHLAIALGMLHASSVIAQTPNACDGPTVVDPRTFSAGGVDLAASPGALREILGDERVRFEPRSQGATDESPEGTLHLDFCGRSLAVELSPGGIIRRVRITQQGFELPEGLGIGAPLSAFDAVLGDRDLLWGEGYLLVYNLPESRRNLFVGVPDRCYIWQEEPVAMATGVDATCPVSWIAF